MNNQRTIIFGLILATATASCASVHPSGDTNGWNVYHVELGDQRVEFNAPRMKAKSILGSLFRYMWILQG